MNERESIIESIIFWKGEPISFKKLSELSKYSENEVRDAVKIIAENISKSGIRLIETNDEVSLATAKESGEIIEKLQREELSKELTKATLETLSIIAYIGPIKRSKIDYIRGVNSQFSLRHLEIRGLVERIPDKNDNRTFEFRVTNEFMKFMGIENIEMLPEIESFRVKINEYQKRNNEEETQNNTEVN